MIERRRILLIQLPIPQPGMDPAQGNVPLAAGYLKLLARLRGLEDAFEIEILPASLANRLSDRGLAAEILDRDPWLVGWTCYLWNVERSLDISRQVKQVRPDVRILVGGPEITSDNAWVLERPEVDFAAIGEGEQTFCELLADLRTDDVPRRPIPGLYVSPALLRTIHGEWSDDPLSRSDLPPFRRPLPNLNEVSSPYLAGILDAADEQMLLLETLRGCVFKCKFCYYPKSYDDLYFVSQERIIANLEHARRRGAREVILLDPTLNQRRDFDDFLKLLAECNPERQFTYFGELRAEGINEKTARLLQAANFTQVEIGLQSIDPAAQELMDRKNNLKAFERGVRALRDMGIGVKVDLIIGLPGDTPASIRRSLHYLKNIGLYDDVQVFNLSVLPGTAFRHEASDLGLVFQSRPPYYVLKTPTLDLPDLYQLMDEAEELFDTEFDPLPEPQIPNDSTSHEKGQQWLCPKKGSGPFIMYPAMESTTTGRGPDPYFGQSRPQYHACRIDLDADPGSRINSLDSNSLPPSDQRSQAFALWLRADDFRHHGESARKLIEQLLDENPHTTLQVLLEPGDGTSITVSLLADLQQACYRRTTYLDRFYSILPGPMKGSKRLVVLFDVQDKERFDFDTVATMDEFATILWKDPCTSSPAAQLPAGR